MATTAATTVASTGSNAEAYWSSDGKKLIYQGFTKEGSCDQVYTMNADGTDQRCISANYLNDFTPSVMSDGRLIYSRWEYVDKPAIPIQSLWTIHPDGTALAGFFGNRVLSPGTFMEARSIPGTQKIICTMTGSSGVPTLS